MKTTAKIIRFVFIIFFALTAAFNVLGGAGTSCAAFLTEKYPSMTALMDYRWLYQLFVVVTALIGLAGVWAMVRLIRGGLNVLRNALLVLLAGNLVGYIHMFASDNLRGKSTPANMVFYVNLITLIVGLLLLIPGIKKHVQFLKKSGKSENNLAAGSAAFVSGMATLSTWMWVGSTHIYQGENWVDVLVTPIILVGFGLVLFGLILFIKDLIADFSGKPVRSLFNFDRVRKVNSVK